MFSLRAENKSITMSGTESNKIESHCNKCGDGINHTILGKAEKPWSEMYSENIEVTGGRTYMILECAGCGLVSMRRDAWCSEDYEIDAAGFSYNVEKIYYPARIFRKKPSWLTDEKHKDKWPVPVVELLDEAYVGMQNECRRSTAMALRAVIEVIMIERVEDQGSFKKNLAAFQELGHLSRNDREVIDAVLEVGHASIHRGYSPDYEALVLCFDITERLVQLVYSQQSQAKGLWEKIPKRS